MKYLKTSKLFSVLTLLLISAFTFTACDDNGAGSDSGLTVVETAQESDNFTILVEALYDTELDAALSGPGPFTVFAPTNDAFNALPSGLLESLTNEQLAQVLQYHVLAGEIAAGDLESSQAVQTLTEETIYVTVSSEGEVMVNNTAEVINPNIEASNGIIHAIDGVILPNEFQNIVEIASKNYELSTLVSLVAEAGLVETLQGDGPFTVFAPTNEAFEEVSSTLEGLSAEQVREVLTYHVATVEALSTEIASNDLTELPTVQGENITITLSGAEVVINGSAGVNEVDLQGTNGVVHIIDSVLLPPSYTE
ncbi:fasciclin domain-containing protein [Gracilimonas mengyeensis]|uniref:Uncaracterized surface protein containing fasciclin (FAS1) repeats n=1 Tax=Gracilimonas mengyeensis TaxID=1302730 RepID=A0A521DWI7_9BACT|nr:fasciclin domain-containing protein [Gracilimonas mengyeensis]SMO75240.1 Uncaracterized surface protein containing fasciclin (FAS1) repeats [Gracilimonas mengyeensis]